MPSRAEMRQRNWDAVQLIATGVARKLGLLRGKFSDSDRLLLDAISSSLAAITALRDEKPTMGRWEAIERAAAHVERLVEGLTVQNAKWKRELLAAAKEIQGITSDYAPPPL